MKTSWNVVKGTAIGLAVGGAAGAVMAIKLKPKAGTKKKISKALKSAVDFIDEMW